LKEKARTGFPAKKLGLPLMRKKFWWAALVVVLACIVAEAGSRTDWLVQAEQTFYDLWHQLAGPRYTPAHLVIVAIDDQTRLEHQDEPLLFWGPHFARAIKVLRAAGVSVIGLDFLFSVSAESWLKRLELPVGDLSRRYDQPFREQLAAGQVVAAASMVIDEKGKSQIFLPLADYYYSLPRHLDDVGLTNFFNDPDGVIRRFTPILADSAGEAWLTFSGLLAARAMGREELDSGQTLCYIGFAGPPGTIPRISFRRLLRPGAENDPELIHLKGKVAIIATETSMGQDITQTPYARGFLSFRARMMSGVEVHANIVETLLTGKSPRPVAPVVNLGYLVGVLTVSTVLFFKLSPWQGLAAGAFLALLCSLWSYFMFLGYWILPLAGVQLGIIVCYIGSLGVRLRGEERERVRLRELFGRYVSDVVVEKLLASKKYPALGGESLEVTVLFVDIRDFTPLAECLRPAEVVEMLNAYFPRICEPILEEGGTVDKFIGDAVMAVFGSPAVVPDHARRALKCAVQIARCSQEFLTWLQQRFAGQDIEDFRIGIGLHTGEVVVGNIGTPWRLEFTSVGDTVNIASRLEGLSKSLGWIIVASQETILAAGPGVVIGRQAEVSLKGRKKSVAVLEVLDINE
jgi:adenylate cyclase